MRALSVTAARLEFETVDILGPLNPSAKDGNKLELVSY